MAVCQCVPKACDTLKLQPADIVEYEFDWKRFCEALCELLHVVPVAEPLSLHKGLWQVGSWAVNATDHRPVFLVATATRTSFDAAVGALLIAHQTTFVVLSPTLRFSGGSAIEGLRRRGATLLSLEDILHPEGGKLVAAGTLSQLAGSGTRSEGATEAEENVFRREQDVWAISFAGKTVRLKHLAGLGYVAELLRAPGKEIDAITLTGYSVTDAAAGPNAGIDLADETAIRQVKSELDQRRTELARLAPNDWVRKGDLTSEIEKLEDYLRDVQGLQGRSRKAAGDIQRARSAATHAVKRAIDRIERDHGPLAEHLRHSIRTGNTLLYLPSEPIEWRF
ncbi:MAG: hypothetical protein IT165_06010 [Bryobacterales bacterium]|nr:hypothetical protein [Bryobacterales bacterium]